MKIFGYVIQRDDGSVLASTLDRQNARMLALINERLKTMSVELDRLTQQVKANNDLLDSATTLINGIADRIVAAGTDQAALTALADELKAKDEQLAAAVAANTPAA